MMAARAFITLSCILTPLSAVFTLSILLIRENFKKIISMLAKILCIGSLIGGILGITLGIIFVAKKDEIMVAFDIGVSSILTIIAVVFNLFGTIATLIINRDPRETPKPEYDSDGVNNN
jgi:Mg/Co/Ni transporter MgtE